MKKLVLFSLFLAAVVIILGAYTRLTDAGLGCPDWPGCYGNLTVPSGDENVEAANTAYPDRPVEAHKAWNEMIHRYFAGALTSASRFPARIQQISISTASELLSLNLLPYVVVLTAKNDLFVRRYNSVVMPPEKHLGYAIQWFGLAIAAALIGGFAIMKKGRQYELSLIHI